MNLGDQSVDGNITQKLSVKTECVNLKLIYLA
jgi:hypothetical protein